MEGLPGEMTNVIITPKTRLPYGIELEMGDWVVVFGPGTATTVEAFGVREVMDEGE